MNEKLISRKDLCDKIGMNPASLRKYLSRGTMFETENGIDLENEFNKECLIKYASKKGIDIIKILYTSDPKSKPKQKKPPKSKSDKDISKEIKSKNPESTLRYSKLRDGKLEQESELKRLQAENLNLEIQRKRAKILPSEFAIEMLQRYLDGTCGAIVNSANILIEDMCNEFDADTATKLKYKRVLKAIVNDTIKSQHKPVSDEIIKLAKEFALQTKW
jgi:hypothetical protein